MKKSDNYLDNYRIAVLPGSIPFRINEWLTHIVRGNPAERIDLKQRLEKGIDNLR
jgi:hypothetical protein